MSLLLRRYFPLTILALGIVPLCAFAQQSAMVSATVTNTTTMTEYYQKYTSGNTQEKIALIKGLPNALSQFSRNDSLPAKDTALANANKATARQMLQNALNNSSEELSIQAINSISENSFSDLSSDVLAVYNKTSNSTAKRSAALRTLAALDYSQLLPTLNAILQSQTIDKLTFTALRIIDNKKMCKALPNVKSLVQKAKDLNAQYLKDNNRQSDELVELSERAESVFQHLVSNGPCNE